MRPLWEARGRRRLQHTLARTTHLARKTLGAGLPVARAWGPHVRRRAIRAHARAGAARDPIGRHHVTCASQVALFSPSYRAASITRDAGRAGSRSVFPASTGSVDVGNPTLDDAARFMRASDCSPSVITCRLSCENVHLLLREASHPTKQHCRVAAHSSDHILLQITVLLSYGPLIDLCALTSQNQL